jgi:hypothetical protein
MKTVSKLQLDWMERCTTILHNMGCEFEIVAPDGRIHSNRPEVQKQQTFTEYLAAAPEKKRSGPIFKKGEQMAYFVPLIEGLKPGEVAQVPLDKFKKDNLSGGITAWCTRYWGPGSFMTSATSGNYVEVMRIK